MSPEAAAARGWIKRTSSPCNSGWRVARYSKQLSVAVWQGKVMAMSTSSSRFATSKGVRPGDSIRLLKARYPVTRLGTNRYTSGAVLGVPGTDLYFTMQGGRVSSIELANGFVPDGSAFEC